jgi:hypothetical protein
MEIRSSARSHGSQNTHKPTTAMPVFVREISLEPRFSEWIDLVAGIIHFYKNVLHFYLWLCCQNT